MSETVKVGNHHCSIKKNRKGEKRVTHEEKPCLEQIGGDGKEWVKSANGSAATVTHSYSEIRFEVDTL